MTSRPGPNGQQSLSWTADGELASVSDASGRTDYVTDPAGGRLVTRDTKGTTLHLGATEIRFDKASTAVTATRYYSFLGEVVAQRTTGGGITWLAGDHQGTGQIAVSGNATQAATRRRQTPFGTERGPATTWPNPRGFVGGYQESTGLTQVGQRAYDPKKRYQFAAIQQQGRRDMNSVGPAGFSYKSGHRSGGLAGGISSGWIPGRVIRHL
ncbi:hypothetical protein ACLQ24_11470 [Micromonospora sp. DT4]|uniref:hypothetical protein n=1 Tax=Micromonospora sp. DT4 TaxID=3393438 RepID=UPI003CF89176